MLHPVPRPTRRRLQNSRHSAPQRDARDSSRTLPPSVRNGAPLSRMQPRPSAMDELLDAKDNCRYPLAPLQSAGVPVPRWRAPENRRRSSTIHGVTDNCAPRARERDPGQYGRPFGQDGPGHRHAMPPLSRRSNLVVHSDERRSVCACPGTSSRFRYAAHPGAASVWYLQGSRDVAVPFLHRAKWTTVARPMEAEAVWCAYGQAMRREPGDVERFSPRGRRPSSRARRACVHTAGAQRRTRLRGARWRRLPALAPESNE